MICGGCVTRHHCHHYFGFAETQWKLLGKEQPRRVKPLLYVFRVLLTGIHLMRAREVEANLLALNEEFKLPYVPELIARKLAGPEKSALEVDDVSFFESEYQRLRGELERAAAESTLPETPSTKAGLNELLLRVRMKYVTWAGACPVCGLENAFDGPGSFDICPRCGWEDDSVQWHNPDHSGGAIGIERAGVKDLALRSTRRCHPPRG